MKGVILCESSGEVREAFRALGFDFWSCDTQPADDGSPYHYQCDAREILNLGWGFAGMHPPCTFLSSSGMHWTTRGLRDPKLTEDAIAFAEALWNAPIDLKYLENPIGALSTKSKLGKATQIIQPWMFGHPESKATCLWLEGLPPLLPTHELEPLLWDTPVLPLPERGRWDNQTDSGQNKLPPSKDRWKQRSKTYEGIAHAMAAQWAPVILKSLSVSS